VPTDVAGTHLLALTVADDGLPLQPVITLHLGGRFFVQRIEVFGGGIAGYAIPGALSQTTVEFDEMAATLATVPFGNANVFGISFNDRPDLTGTPLAGVATDTIVLRDFAADLFGFPLNEFSVGEIKVWGTPSAVSVAIDVKLNDPRNRIRSTSGEPIAVAILSDSRFDAPTAADRASLTFGRSGDEQSVARCEPRARDVNADGRGDLVCFFDAGLADFRTGDVLATLKGRTSAGDPLIGRDTVCVDLCRGSRDQ
jgi:hypothetical protein